MANGANDPASKADAGWPGLVWQIINNNRAVAVAILAACVVAVLAATFHLGPEWLVGKRSETPTSQNTTTVKDAKGVTGHIGTGSIQSESKGDGTTTVIGDGNETKTQTVKGNGNSIESIDTKSGRP